MCLVKQIFFIFCKYKIYSLSDEGYKNTDVCFLRIKKTGEIWSSMENVHKRSGVQNISNLVLKEIYGIHKTKDLTKEQIKKYKMTEREVFENYDNLSEDELSKASNKNIYVKNDVTTNGIKRCRGEKKKKKRRKKNRCTQKKVDGSRI